jgi:UDP-GlcNAc:undecaprenyl-phosphate GlcNAc-1-phosphate transferase
VTALGSGFLVAFAISWLLTWLLIRLAPRLGLVDHPGARKVHTQPTPRGGGLAIYAALVAAACLFPSVLHRELITALGAGFVIVLLGLLDDLRPLPWQLRLGVQMLAAGVVVMLWPADVPWLIRGLSVLWIAGLVNAFNMLDNMDALSAGVALIAAGMFAASLVIPSIGAQEALAALPFLMLMGALSGFLWFNCSPARIFMGDAGSTFLGFFLGLASLQRIYAGEPISPTWAVPFCILAVPCYDLATVVALRLWQGKSPFQADKQHLSHRLVALGLTSVTAVSLIHLMALASGVAGLLLFFIPNPWTYLVAILMASWWFIIASIEYFRHFQSMANEK